MIRFVISWAVFCIAGSVIAEGEVVTTFLKTYCVECHGPEKQKGDKRLDDFHMPKDEAGIIEAQEIIDLLTLEEMPPQKADKQPTDKERAEIIRILTTANTAARAAVKSTGGQTVLRRLTKREYLQTIGDLFSLDMRTFDTTSNFPKDQEAEHMDNIGDVLQTSGYLLYQYLEASDQIVEKALGQRQKPPVRNWKFAGDFYQQPELRISHKLFNYRYLCLYEVPNTVNHEGGYGVIDQFKSGVHADGTYEIKVLAHSKNRDHPYDPSIFRFDPRQPFRLGVVSGDEKAGILYHPQPIEPQLAEVTVRDGEPQWYTMKVRLEKGQTPRFIFPNGMANCRSAFAAVANRYMNHWPEKVRSQRFGIVDARRVVVEHGSMPHIRIHEVRVKGPINASWPPPNQVAVFGKGGFKPTEVRETLRLFADRAYRRPVSEDEVDRLMSVFQKRRAAGQDPRNAFEDSVKAILCSPAFLYLAEPGRDKVVSTLEGNTIQVETLEGQNLDAHDLAARLSYFLWASMPDDELRKAADDGSILRPQVLRQQAVRMLKDSRSDAFIHGFLDSWLHLRSLGGMPPDRDSFRSYYEKDLQNDMKEEARIFPRDLITRDGPTRNFLQSNYAFVNQDLATHYALPNKFKPAEAHLFHKVELTSKRRGGLLGMGGVLTVTANGIETSPVTRGVWVLENIFGTPPNPPPDDVPEIEPDARGTTTIREQLAKHRNTPACMDCHERIDPIGFGLENFDPVGRWRDHYTAGKKKGPKINSNGKFANGDEFKEIWQFKNALLEREDQFQRNLCERLLTYAVGRRVEELDRPEVDGILKKVDAENGGLKTLILEIVQSDLFRSP